MLCQFHCPPREFDRFFQVPVESLRIGLQGQKCVLDPILPLTPLCLLLHLCGVALAKGKQVTGLVQIDLIEFMRHCLFVDRLSIVADDLGRHQRA